MTTRFLVRLVPVLLAFGVSAPLMADLPQYHCPDASLGETAADCPWAAIARELSDAPTGTDLAKLLKKREPVLHNQIHTLRNLKSGVELWGYCIGFDELARGIVVDPKILAALYGISKVPVPDLGAYQADNIQHAGLQHTYGYLFSVLKTAFGYKRARWVSGEIDRGFGLQDPSISPRPKKGTLFANVTYLAGRIAFRHEPQALVALEGMKGAVDPALVKHKFGKLKVTRLEETVELAYGHKVTLRTDLVTFPVAPAEATPAPNDTLLIYSFLDAGQPKLVTAFPVTASFGAGIMKPETLGANQPIITRYNAWIGGFTGVTDLKGTRNVTERADAQ